MLIDAHTHAYTQRDRFLIRERTALLDESLPAEDPNKWILRHEGSIDSLLREEAAAGVDRFVLLPVSSHPERVRELNRWVCKQAESHPQIIPFGTLVPRSSSLEADLAEILSMVLKGIKIHPFLQRVDILSPEAGRLWTLLERAGLPLLLDTMSLEGLTRYKPHLAPLAQRAKELDSGPEKVAALSRRHPGLTLIAAHLGSLYGWDRLDGLYPLENVYFDLSFISSLLPVGQVMEVIRSKGSHRVLFGTDSPWRDPKEARRWFEALPLENEAREAIAWKNLEDALSR